MLKLKAVDKEFTNENGQKVPYKEIVAPINISNIPFEIRVGFNEKNIKSNVLTNIDLCDLDLEDRSYDDKSGVRRERFVPVIRVGSFVFDVVLESAAVFLLRLVKANSKTK